MLFPCNGCLSWIVFDDIEFLIRDVGHHLQIDLVNVVIYHCTFPVAEKTTFRAL